MNPIEALKKAHQAMAITADDSNMQKFVIINQDKVTGRARMNVTGIEAKYVPSSHAKYPDSTGYRTRFFLADGTTVGTFSNGAYMFFQFFAAIMGHQAVPNFLHIDINGMLAVDVTILALDGNKSTYNFELIEADSDFRGLGEYSPTASLSNVLALEGGWASEQPALTEGETEEAAEAEPEAEKEVEAEKKPAKSTGNKSK